MPKHQILENIKKNKPKKTELPAIPIFAEKGNLIKEFKEVSGLSSTVFELNNDNQLAEFISRQYSGKKTIVDFTNEEDLHNIDSVDIEVLVLEGTIGVAENGAVWVEEKNMGQSLLPFSTQHLVLKLNKLNIVSNMHRAYKMITLSRDFGVFIAGPSKTADIEQVLVVGAHGPRSLAIVLY